jgi:hypothetical protein
MLPVPGVPLLHPSILHPDTPFSVDIQPLPTTTDVQEQPMPVTLPAEKERSPTPLSDFRVDEHQLSTLQYDLCSKTAQLSVELLGCIWRHRTEWDRDDLVRELKDTLKEFLDDFAAASGVMNPTHLERSKVW